LLLLLAVSASCPVGIAGARDNTAPVPPPADRHVAEGLSIELSVRPVGGARPGGLIEGDDAELSFRITDAS
jgi:hypothetical protein